MVCYQLEWQLERCLWARGVSGTMWGAACTPPPAWIGVKIGVLPPAQLGLTSPHSPCGVKGVPGAGTPCPAGVSPAQPCGTATLVPVPVLSQESCRAPKRGAEGMGLWGLHPTGLAQGLVQAGEGQGCVLPSVETFFALSLTHSSGHGQGWLPAGCVPGKPAPTAPHSFSN